MSFDKLKPVWPQILSHLAAPRPKALSGWIKQEAVGESEETVATLLDASAPGTTSRRDIRAGALVVLMRTSVEFNQLAAPHLYRHITTDRLPALLAGYTSHQAHPHVESKCDLLQHVETLALEYTFKGDNPSYLDILASRKNKFLWPSIGSLSPMPNAERLAILEAEQLREGLTLCCQLYPYPFPKLSNLTVGAIFGGQDGLFDKLAPADETHNSTWSPIRTLFMDCRSLLEQVFRRGPLLHFCQRGSAGPLSLPPVIKWFNPIRLTSAPTDPYFTFHFGLNGKPLPAAALARRTRWVLENRDQHRDGLQVNKAVNTAVRHAQHERRQELEYLKTLSPSFPSTSFDLEVYCSSDHPPMDAQNLSAANYAAFLASRFDDAMERKAQSSYAATWVSFLEERHDGTPKSAKDNIVWKSSLDTPVCQACRAGLEREVEKGFKVIGPKRS